MSNSLATKVILSDECPSTNKFTLVESTLPTKEAGISVLCSIDGPVASYGVPTRNDRIYTEDLLDNIFTSDYVTEMINTRNFLGEANHPADYQYRLDIDYPSVSHAVRNLRKVPEEECWYATFDILDTPNGRILKTLVDYGVQIGASSRGAGTSVSDPSSQYDIVSSNDYIFITFDAVCYPGNQMARLTNVTNESTNLTSIKLEEQVNLLIKNKDLEGLKTTKQLLTFLGESADPSIVSKVSDALDNSSYLNADVTNDDLIKAYRKVKDLQELLTSKEELIEVLTAKLETNANESEIGINNLIDNSSYQVIDELCPEDYQVILNSLTTELEVVSSQRDELTESYQRLYSNYVQCTKSLKLLETYENKFKDTQAKLQQLTQENVKLKDSIKLTESTSLTKNSKLASDLKSYQNKVNLLESKVSILKSESSGIQANASKFFDGYCSLRCKQLNINESLALSKLHKLDISSIDFDVVEQIISSVYESVKPNVKSYTPEIDVTKKVALGQLPKNESTFINPDICPELDVGFVGSIFNKL